MMRMPVSMKKRDVRTGIPFFRDIPHAAAFRRFHHFSAPIRSGSRYASSSSSLEITPARLDCG